MGSLIQPDHFTHILRILNTNVDGRNKIMYAMTNIRGIGRRFSNFACKKGEVDMQKRAGECSAEDIENLMLITSNPRAYKTPDWFLNRQKVRSTADETFAQLSSGIDCTILPLSASDEQQQ
jgi:small subunit ribosomal protein S18e